MHERYCYFSYDDFKRLITKFWFNFITNFLSKIKSISKRILKLCKKFFMFYICSFWIAVWTSNIYHVNQPDFLIPYSYNWLYFKAKFCLFIKSEEKDWTKVSIFKVVTRDTSSYYRLLEDTNNFRCSCFKACMNYWLRLKDKENHFSYRIVTTGYKGLQCLIKGH